MRQMEEMERPDDSRTLDEDIVKANAAFMSVAYKYNRDFREAIINMASSAVKESEVGRSLTEDSCFRIAKRVTDRIFDAEG